MIEILNKTNDDKYTTKIKIYNFEIELQLEYKLQIDTFNYYSINLDGSVFLYEKKPTMLSKYWYSDDKFFVGVFDFKGDWKESLIEINDEFFEVE